MMKIEIMAIIMNMLIMIDMSNDIKNIKSEKQTKILFFVFLF